MFAIRVLTNALSLSFCIVLLAFGVGSGSWTWFLCFVTFGLYHAATVVELLESYTLTPEA